MANYSDYRLWTNHAESYAGYRYDRESVLPLPSSQAPLLYFPTAYSVKRWHPYLWMEFPNGCFSFLEGCCYRQPAASALSLCTCQLYVAVDEAPNTPGGIRFEKEIGELYSLNILENASGMFWKLFVQTSTEDRRNYHLITLRVKEINGGSVTFTSNGSQSEIYMSPSYIAAYVGDVKREFTGMMFHEIARIRQWTGNSEAPIGLLTGIADYFRLSAGYESANWCKQGEGSEWDEGYDVTARFLNYCESRHAGMVVFLNGWMRFGYSVGMFYEYTGSTVDELWYDYKSLYAARG